MRRRPLHLGPRGPEERAAVRGAEARGGVGADAGAAGGAGAGGGDAGGVREGGGDRPRDDQLRGGGDGGREADGHHQRRGPADDALRGGVHQGRGAAGRADRQAAGRRQPGEHLLLRQALHRPQDGRGRRRGQAGLLPRRPRRQRQRQARLPRHRQAVRRRGDFRAGDFFCFFFFLALNFDFYVSETFCLLAIHSICHSFCTQRCVSVSLNWGQLE